MVSLATSLLFLAITREISKRYASEIFRRIQLISFSAIGFSVLGFLTGLFGWKISHSFEWSAYAVLWISALHMWGLPWKEWMRFGIPGVSLMAVLVGVVTKPEISGVVDILLIIFPALQLYIRKERKLESIPLIATLVLLVFMLIDIMFPSYIWRGWEGTMIGYALIHRIIAYLHAIYHQSITDRLTGLYNRSTFIQYVDDFIKTGRKTSVIFLDLDNFKEKNDTEGHEAGDQALRSAAELLREAVHGIGVAGRIGGEEMVLVVVEEDALPIAEKIRSLLPVRAGITASIGVSLAKEGLEAQEVIHHADLAMYEAKRSGKNRVVQYTHNS